MIFKFMIIVLAIGLFISIIVEGTKKRTANPTPNDEYDTVFLDDGNEYSVKELSFLPRNMVRIITNDGCIILTSANKCIFTKNKSDNNKEGADSLE